MKLGDLSQDELARRLRTGDITLESGPFLFRLGSQLPQLAAGLSLAYPDYALDDTAYADFHVRLAWPNGLRRALAPQVQFYHDGFAPFLPLPAQQAYAMLEWGMNWCISQHANQYLILHAAVLERNGRALILPGSSGSGKSTLCAALVYAGGWRLLSDELTLIRPADGLIQPLPRPISLKNASITVIRQLAPEVVFTPTLHDTSKGTVAHGRAPASSVALQRQCALPAWVVFPKYRVGGDMAISRIPPAQLVLQLAEQAFNYSLHGQAGFTALADMAERVQGLHFAYSDLSAALAWFETLAGSAAQSTDADLEYAS